MKLEVWTAHLNCYRIHPLIMSDTELVKSTTMFGRLADPDGENNALSQVLYGLALRCDPISSWNTASDVIPASKLTKIQNSGMGGAVTLILKRQSSIYPTQLPTAQRLNRWPSILA
jgi:hypothetical protein